MKRPEYVAVVTGVYARLLEEGRGPTAQELAQLEAAFSRSGFTDLYWQGRRGPEMFGTRPENALEPKELFAAARAGYEKDAARTVPVDFSCEVRAGRPCVLTARDPEGRRVTVTGPAPEAARTRALTAEDLAARLTKTGGTAYRCARAEAAVDQGLSLSAGTVNALRRDALSALSAVRTAPPARREEPAPALPAIDCACSEPAFTLSVSSVGQLSPALLALKPARVYVPLEAFRDIPALPAGETAWCAVLPRIWRDGDEPMLRSWLEKAKALGVSAAAVGNLGHLPLARDAGLPLWGDFGLNVFNSRSLDLLRRLGLESACASFELRSAQLRDLRKVLPVEALVYGRLPLMVTENCLIQNSVGCRCDRPNVLNDRTGASFPLLPVFGHRTEVENSKPLWLADRPELWRLGLSFARLRFTTEPPELCAEVFRAYLDRRPAQGDFTRGLFDRGVE